MRVLLLILLVSLMINLGCGRSGPKSDFEPRYKSDPSPDAKNQTTVFGIPGESLSENSADQAKVAFRAEKRVEVPEHRAEVARKVIYTADVSLIVDNLEQTQVQLKDLVAKEKGYVAQSEVGGSPGTPRWGRWKVRVPAERLEPFLTAVASFGEPERSSTDSRDVTEEYYDLDARIRNKKVEEDRLLKHLEKSTGKLEDILAVERELSRVRDEIDRHEGRLRLLANLADLTTVSISVHERQGYEPEGSPSFGTSAGRTFWDSLDALLRVGRALALAGVALAPWLPILALLTVLLYGLRKRLRPAVAPAPTPAQQP